MFSYMPAALTHISESIMLYNIRILLPDTSIIAISCLIIMLSLHEAISTIESPQVKMPLAIAMTKWPLIVVFLSVLVFKAVYFYNS
jgi:hypothetical protein